MGDNIHRLAELKRIIICSIVVLVQGYKQRDAFIVTQMPMPHTIIDFWTMIHDHSCRTIIMLNDLNSTDKVKSLWQCL